MDELQQELFKLQDLKYRNFHSKLMPGIDKETIIGIRTPVLRKFAKEFAKTEAAEAFLLYRKFLKSSEIVYNRLEIKNDITKERRGLRHDVVYEVFCFGLG